MAAIGLDIRGSRGSERSSVVTRLLLATLVWLVGVCGLGATGAFAQGTYKDLDAAAQGMEVEEHLGRTVPLELDFVNDEGQRVFLRDYFTNTNKPAVVAMVFYRCPIACQVVMEKFAECMNSMDLQVGKDFRALYFSIDPMETTELAKSTKEKFLHRYNKDVTPQVRADWRFHTGTASAAKQLSESLGFPYRPDGKGGFAHPVALFVLSPEGKIVRYIHGFTYPPRDVKLALIEASSGRLGQSLGDRLLGFCYMYDPNTGKYTLVARRVMQVGGVLMIAGLGSLVGVMLVTERVLKKKRAQVLAAGPGGAGSRASSVTGGDSGGSGRMNTSSGALASGAEGIAP